MLERIKTFTREAPEILGGLFKTAHMAVAITTFVLIEVYLIVKLVRTLATLVSE